MTFCRYLCRCGCGQQCRCGRLQRNGEPLSPKEHGLVLAPEHPARATAERHAPAVCGEGGCVLAVNHYGAHWRDGGAK